MKNMKKLLIAFLLIGSLFVAFKVGAQVGQVEGKAKANTITERVITRVVTTKADKYGQITVVNIHNSHDVIAIDAIKGVKVGQGVQVDFTHDTVTHTKKLNYFPYKS
jgi:hypothetical protein